MPSSVSHRTIKVGTILSSEIRGGFCGPKFSWVEGICVIMISAEVLWQDGQAVGEKQLLFFPFQRSYLIVSLFGNCSFSLS